MTNLNIPNRKELEKMSATQLIDFKMKIIQSKFDKVASDNEILQSKIIFTEKSSKTLRKNLTPIIPRSQN